MPELPTLPAIADAPLSVVLLADDPAAFGMVATEWVDALSGRGGLWELVAVTAPAVDPEGIVANELVGRPADVRVVGAARDAKVGGLFRVGLDTTGHPLLLVVPGDGSFPPSELAKLTAEIDKVHLAAGCRAAQRPPWWLLLPVGLWRLVLRVLFGLPLESAPGWHGWRARAARLVARHFFGVRIHDPTWPGRLYRREVFERLLVQSDGEFAHVEVVAKSNFLGHLMTEVPLADRPGRPALWTRWVAEARRLFAEPTFRTPKPAAVAPVPAPALDGGPTSDAQ